MATNAKYDKYKKYVRIKNGKTSQQTRNAKKQDRI